MRIVKPGEKITRKELKYFARMAARAYINDPVHSYATKNPKKRERFVYHFMLERLTASNGTDYICIDDDKRGMCVWRQAHNEYTVLDFLKCPNWVFLCLYLPNTIRTLSAYSALDVKVFEKNTWIISPVFTDPLHQGKGIATALIRQGIELLSPSGCKLGLEAQSRENEAFYEKLGFRTIEHSFAKHGNIDHRYMVFESHD